MVCKDEFVSVCVSTSGHVCVWLYVFWGMCLCLSVPVCVSGVCVSVCLGGVFMYLCVCLGVWVCPFLVCVCLSGSVCVLCVSGGGVCP